ncbi:MAG: TIGR02266 family protein [Myxococcales bacterium]|nr:TIGR02266 family protein [Myxococcales bacterium]
MDDQSKKSGRERRQSARFPTHIKVDYKHGETFLFSYIENISEMGIFIYSETPLPLGTELSMRFEHDGTELFITGVVMWVNPVRQGENVNPGMGVRFTDLTNEARQEIVGIVETVAYLTGADPKDLN